MALVACPCQRRLVSGCVDSCGNAGNADATAYDATARWHAECSSAMIAVPAHASWRGEAAASGVQLRQQLLLTGSPGLPRHPPHSFLRRPPFSTLTRHTVVGYRRAALSLPCSAKHCKLGQQLRYGFGVPYWACANWPFCTCTIVHFDTPTISGYMMVRQILIQTKVRYLRSSLPHELQHSA